MPKKPKKPKKKRSRPRATAAAAPRARALHYKVVELSNVDEGALERTLNEWVSRGWTFDGVQFAMRESSKRPSMGFVFFTREGEPVIETTPETDIDRELAALLQLERLSREAQPEPTRAPATDPWDRLRTFASEEEGEP
jgi:hypothetical protein